MKIMAPAVWPVVRLAEIAQVRTGVAKNGEKKLKQPVELPYLRVANVQDGHVDLREIKTIEVEAADVSRYRLEAGDVLMTEGGDFDKLGRGTVWSGEISPCLHQNHVFAVRVDRSTVLPEFLAAYCAAEPGRRYFLGCSKQTTNLASVNSTQLKELPIPVPPIAEQRRIVAVLDACDAEISVGATFSAHTNQFHQAMVRGLVGRVSAPMVRLGDVVARVARAPESADATPLTISAALGLIPQTRFFGKRVASRSVGTYTLLWRGEFAYNKSYSDGYPLGATKRLEVVDAGILSSLYLCFGVSDEARLDGDYLAIVFDSGWFNKQLQQIAQEGARNHGLLNVSASDFFDMQLQLPSLDAQRKTIRAVKLAKAQQELAERRLNTLKRRKRGLMRKLLTGQWRLAGDATGDLSDREAAHA